MTYALDSNMVILLLNSNASVVEKRKKAVQSGAKFIIPPIVDYEICRGLRYNPSKAKEQRYSEFVKHYGIGNMTSSMWKIAVSIYVDLKKKGFTVGDADILIAAFCVENNCILVTRNTKHFVNIDDLSIVNWADS